MTDLVFEDPPPRALLAPWLAELRDHPDVWAKYHTPMYGNIATRIRRGEGYGASPGEFEVRTVGSSAKVTLYARYVGGDK